ncbi:uncharacterized protein B0I36DRAFT_20097 [Microdochium trichocladiopsis]|uniref:Uncharacterized protein n=1 Tax=Microdochium trichocladiopsis TaxID=1682393 RepID=A0A9P8YJR9_9PEZI|nr:uncharacterized protein B0I36DRAFT_20097 [Microdochium trichocladiopsis]KAH7041163.1 hypothetical protein B0I36DRAFT_20097 [Microdochium trichocladiopsis]
MDKKKIVHQLDTPYSTAKWPEIALDDQDTVLELLCTLLSPIGEHRAQHVQRSKGKRDTKRKRTEKSPGTIKAPSPPPAPELLSHIDVGLVAVTRRLQNLSKDTRADPPKIQLLATGEDKAVQRPCAAVFVARASQPSILNSHLPQLIAVASQALPDEEPIRLFGISKSCEARLSDALGIPRVSCIAMDADAPGAKTILSFVRERVPPVTLEWLAVARSGEYQTTNIKHVATTIGARKQVAKT